MSALRSFVRFGLLPSLFLALTSAHAVDLDQPDGYDIDPQFEIVRPDGAGAATVTLAGDARGPLRFEFDADAPIVLTTDMLAELRAADGLYAWRATFEPILDEATRALLAASRTDDSIAPPAIGVPSRSGSIRLVDGGFLASVIEPLEGDDGTPPTRDQIIGDDLIVNGGSLCVGFDCVDGESFGSDTIRIKENNLRIHFQDTSNSGSFPTNDWRLVANSDQNGGAEFFGIQDAGTGRYPLYLEAAAPADAIYLDSSGSVGFGTNQPVVELHVTNGDSPTIRLDQNGSSGFTPQAWDVVGNETSFFVRDATNGSTLPFRIRPTAPSNSLVVDTDGDIGVGILTSAAALHVRRNGTYPGEWLRIDVPDDGDPATEDRRMVLDNAGNLFVGGAITQLSSRHSKGNLLAVAGDQVLAKLAELPLWTWNYLSANETDRHIGPVAEDFYRTFGFGTSERSLSPSDVAGVALAASQALQQEIEERDQRIEELEARLARIEAALLAQENDAETER